MLTSSVQQGSSTQEVRQNASFVFINGLAVVVNDSSSAPDTTAQTPIGAIHLRVRSSGIIVRWDGSGWVSAAELQDLQSVLSTGVVAENTPTGSSITLDPFNNIVQIGLFDGNGESVQQGMSVSNYGIVCNNSVGTGTLGVSSLGWNFNIEDSEGVTGIRFDATRGLWYSQNYSEKFINRSLVDKEYVDNLQVFSLVSNGSGIITSSKLANENIGYITGADVVREKDVHFYITDNTVYDIQTSSPMVFVFNYKYYFTPVTA